VYLLGRASEERGREGAVLPYHGHDDVRLLDVVPAWSPLPGLASRLKAPGPGPPRRPTKTQAQAHLKKMACWDPSWDADHAVRIHRRTPHGFEHCSALVRVFHRDNATPAVTMLLLLLTRRQRGLMEGWWVA
jgi:hypothetical protein